MHKAAWHALGGVRGVAPRHDFAETRGARLGTLSAGQEEGERSEAGAPIEIDHFKVLRKGPRSYHGGSCSGSDAAAILTGYRTTGISSLS